MRKPFCIGVLLLCFIVLISIACADADYYFTYTMNREGKIVISGYHGNATEIEIPSTYADRAVTLIGDGVFSGNGTITSIVIQEGIAEIGDSAFKDCSGLRSVILPESLKKIGHAAFEWCDSLEEITIPAGVEVIEDEAFLNCEKLLDIHVSPDNEIFNDGDGILYNKKEHALMFCPTGKKGDVSILEGTELICTSSFAFGKLRNVSIPESVRWIEDQAFARCTELVSIELPEGVESLGADVFADTGVGAIYLPRSLTKIDRDAFRWASTTIHLYSGSYAESYFQNTRFNYANTR